MSGAANEGARRWYKARQAELREFIWEWDPLGLLGGPVDEYESLEDGVLSALARGGTDTEIEDALRSGLAYMAGEGFSASAAARESETSALLPAVRRIRSWWEAAPPPAGC
jgi:hypothetical protein